jgi:DNA-binding MarR family transcriptional regulator
MMPEPATPIYRFGDLLGLARMSWMKKMASELEARGFPEYRMSDAGSVRLLLVGLRTVGELGELLGVTRQAARKIVTTLEARGYATIAPDPNDGRKLDVVLTGAGRAYGLAIVEVIALLNRALALRVAPDQLQAADAALRAVIDDGVLRARADAIPGPTPAGARGVVDQEGSESGRKPKEQHKEG